MRIGRTERNREEDFVSCKTFDFLKSLYKKKKKKKKTGYVSEL
jgi:hypothetical protein